MSETGGPIDIDNDIDIEGILRDADKSGKITKSQRAAWIRQVLDLKEEKIRIRQLAEILGVSYNKPQKDWKRGRIPDAVKTGPAESRCPVLISKQGAIDYILRFDGTDDFEDPRQMKLPFTDFYDE